MFKGFNSFDAMNHLSSNTMSSFKGLSSGAPHGPAKQSI